MKSLPVKKYLHRFALVLVAAACSLQVMAPATGFAYTEKERLDLMEKGIYFIDEPCGDGTAGAVEGAGETMNGHTLPAREGRTGFEENINANGVIERTSGAVAFADSVRKASTEKKYDDPRKANSVDPLEPPASADGKVSMQDLYRMYYITMRWRYVKWNWNGTAVSPGPESRDFYATAPRVLVTNPGDKEGEPDRSIVAVVLEAGPGPWTGIAASAGSPIPVVDGKPVWTNPQDGTPSNYKGRVSGLPPQAIEDLGASMGMADGSGDELIYSWVSDPATVPGPTQQNNSDTDESENTDCEAEGGDTTEGGAGGNLFRNSSGEACTIDKGGGSVEDGYSNGKKVKIKVCKVHGMQVNVVVETQINNLFNLADEQNKDFTGYGFRTMQRQIELRGINGCPDIYNSPSSACRVPTARPGYSNHQMGLALDLSYKGSLIRSRGNAGFIWLKANAGKYGFKNFPKEAWHWSVNGK